MRVRQLCRSAVFAFLILFLIAPADAAAQRMPWPAPGPRPTEARAALPDSRASFLAIGHQQLGLDPLNQRLEAFGYPTFSEGVVTIGGGGHRLTQRVLFGFEAHGIVSPPETTADNTLRTQLTGGQLTLNLGYAVAATPRFYLAPMIGLGGGALAVEISERSLPTFDDVLRQPRRSSRMTTGMLLVDPGVGLNVRLTQRARPGGVGGLTAGVRAGYTFSPISGEWRLGERTEVAAGPDLGIEGPYVRVTVGRWRQAARRR